jgi:endonuclease/exonuclease/phosphatase family metal-dependent hydrolase
MTINPLTRRRLVSGQEVREPTLLALVLTATGFAFLLVVCLVAIAGLPAFGYRGWIFAAVATILVYLGVGLRRKPQLVAASLTGRQRWLRHICGWARRLFIAVLACWLGLIAWSEFCPGGPNPPPKAEPASIRVVSWNIHCGHDEGLPWERFDWPRRKQPLRMALDQARPDILCVQEATPEQVAFLEGTLPGHRRVGVGRDGESGGEHCAIYFNRQRFAEIGGNTFWLEEPIDQPRSGSAMDVKRICTWVRLRDQVSGRTVRVYNTHLYLTEVPRLTAAQLILAHVRAGDRADAILLTADFNASPAVPSRRLFVEAGLADSAERAGKPAGEPTFHAMYGIGLWCIDGILVDSHWRVANHLVLKVKPKNTFPSDHFAVLADLVLPEKSAASGDIRAKEKGK